MTPRLNEFMRTAVDAFHAPTADALAVNRLFASLDQLEAADVEAADVEHGGQHARLVVNEAYRLRRAWPSSTWQVGGRSLGIPVWELEPLRLAVVAYLFASYR